MVVAEGYKNTEIGVVPEDWDVKSLSSLFEITSSKKIRYSILQGKRTCNIKRKRSGC